MEASERQKLTTKDMARVEGDKKEFEHFNQDPRSLGEAEAALGVPTHLNRVNGEALNPLLSTNEGDHFRSRWQNIQTSFVDEPRRAVEQADELVAEIMQRLAQSFSDQRSRLESEWGALREGFDGGTARSAAQLSIVFRPVTIGVDGNCAWSWRPALRRADQGV